MVHSGEVTKIKLKMAQLFLIMDFLTPMTLNFYFPSHEVIFCQFPVIASTMVITKCVDSLLFSLIQFVMIQPFFRLNLRHQQQYTRRTLEPSICIHHQKLLHNKAWHETLSKQEFRKSWFDAMTWDACSGAGDNIMWCQPCRGVCGPL